VLVILRMLDARGAAGAHGPRRSGWGLFVLLEAFDEADIELAHELVAGYRESPGPTVLVGVNCRDLVTLQVVPERLEQLGSASCRAACRAWRRAAWRHARRMQIRVRAAGYDMALIGSALMRARDPEELCVRC
jgi:indole-3-glycerol phosphate synthase